MAALEDRYRAQQQALLDRVDQSLAALYGSTIEPNELDASFARLFPKAAAVVAAGQAAGITITTAYLSALVLRDGGRTSQLPILKDLVGTSRAGTLDEGMSAWPALVKQRIGEGVDRAEAIAYGAYLVNRFGDGEVTRVSDLQAEHATQHSPHFRGWRGILSATACKECSDNNSGEHPLSQPIYRHGSCNCTKQFLVA